MRPTCLAGLMSAVLASITAAQPNPYCVTGADWRPTNSRMVALAMPGGLDDESGSLGYFWGQFSAYNIAAMTNPCYRWENSGATPPRHCYDVDTDSIRDPDWTEQWILDNPGHVYLIGNEMDNFDLTAGDGMTPQEYARQFHTYAEFITARDPTARMAVGGLYAASDTASVNADIDWWNQVLSYYKTEFGVDMPIDIWNCHCYSFPGSLDPDRIVREFFIPYRTYIDTVSGGIYADKPLWCTEIGVGLWGGALGPQYVAEFIEQLFPYLEQEYTLPETGVTKRVVDRWFWFLGCWEYTWRDVALLEQGNTLPTAAGVAFSQLANSVPNPIPPPPAEPPPPVSLVQSDFEVDASPWRVMAGDWAIDNGSYRQTRMEGFWGLRAHLPYGYRNLHIEADVKINAAEDPNRWAGFNLRGGTVWEGSRTRAYLIFIRQNGELGLHNGVDGTVAAVPDAVADTSVFHHLAVTLFDSSFEIAVDGQVLITWDDPNHRYESGLTSIEAGLSDASFDNVEVIALCGFDAERDGVCDEDDNCVTRSNPDQADGDADGAGDACDNCLSQPNPDQADADADHVGDVCDQCPDTPPGTYITTYGCPTPRCDFDRDGDVDQGDFGRFQVCLSGAGISQNDAACTSARLDDDDDVDQNDFAVFQGCMSGPDIPADPGCAD